MGVSAPPKWPLFAQKRPKNANFGPKPVFFGLGWPVQGPPPYFAGAQLKKTCVPAYGSRKIGASGPPPPKKWPFFAHKWPKNANFGPKKVLCGLGSSILDPSPYFAGAQPKKTCVAPHGTRKIGVSRQTPQKRAIFCPKWPKNANFGPKTVFFGLRWSVQGPPTLFCRCLTQKSMCCRVWERENGCFRAAHPKNGLFCPKWPKNANFGPKTVFFWARVVTSKPPPPPPPPPPILQVLDLK